MSIAFNELDVVSDRAVTTRSTANVTADAGTVTAVLRPISVGPYALRLLAHNLPGTEFSSPPTLAHGRNAAKRSLDVILAVIAITILAPVILILALLIWCVDRKNPFYAQTRVGLNGAGIRVWKLRSMFSDAEQRLARHLESDPAAAAEWNRCFKLTNDPRILPGIGSFIRRTSLDELPQLWNVLRGDMALVGPRPFPAYHLDRFDDEFRRMRTSVVPGLTGLWQITSRSDGDLADQKRWDLMYIANRSLRLDLYILVLTLPAVVMARGAR